MSGVVDTTPRVLPWSDWSEWRWVFGALFGYDAAQRHAASDQRWTVAGKCRRHVSLWCAHEPTRVLSQAVAVCRQWRLRAPSPHGAIARAPVARSHNKK